MRRRISTTSAAIGMAAITVLATGGSAQAHGYSSSPTSRQAFCADGAVSGCGAIQWEPQSVEGPKGFPQGGPSDGTLCAGGNGRFSELDDPRGGDWPTSNVPSGQDFTFTWTNTAMHSTTDYRYYVTKDGWDPSQPLTRSALELDPFLVVPMDGRQPAAEESHTGRLPGKSGRHMIFSVWTVADTGNAFYSCSDVNFQ